MDILQFILSLLLFCIALGVLVSIHELGHLIAAKSFNVYCSEYSIGFGPKIVKLKRKKGETTFNIGIIPLGGYVSMYGEGGDLPEGVKIPKSRSLEEIKRWKRIIIMAAGVLMNFILAYIIFLISAFSSPHLTHDFYYNVLSVNDVALFNEHFKDPQTNENFSLETIDNVINQSVIGINTVKYDYTYTNLSGNEETREVLISNLISAYDINYNGNSDYAFIMEIDNSNFGYNNTELGTHFTLVDGFSTSNIPDEISNIQILNANNEFVALPIDANLNIPLINSSLEIVRADLNLGDKVSLTLPLSYNDENNEAQVLLTSLSLDFNEETFNPIGLGSYANFEWLGWNGFAYAGERWVESTTAIADALASLFYDASAWSGVGGPIAIFTQTTDILANNPFFMYLETWGIISVNLALFNLLPFPGLDGWQILVEIIEGAVNGVYTLKKKSSKKKEVSKIENNNDKKDVIDAKLVDDNITINKEANLTIGDKEEEIDDDPYKDAWKIPQKVKNIMSYVGMILLFGLMFVVVIKDIIGLF